MAKSKYEELKNTLKESKKSSVYSKSTLQKMTNVYFNDLDHESKRVVVSAEGKPEVTTVNPAKEFRAGLKKYVTKTLGVDAAEAEKLDTVDLPTAMTDAALDGVTFVQKDYLDTGKSLKFPMTAENETAMQVSIQSAPEKKFDTTKIEQQADGSYVSVPTGKTVTYKERQIMSVSNKVPEHLKIRKDK